MKNAESAISINQKLLALLLKPVVRFSMRRQFSIQAFEEVLRRVFVQIAEEEITTGGDSPNDSRISVMTGLARREVSACRSSSEPDDSLKSQPIFARVVAQWEQDRKYRDSKGNIRELSCEGERSEFAKLVKSISAHVKPATVLFELQRNGAVELSEGRASLKRATFDTTVDHVRAFSLISKDISALIDAVLHNLEGKQQEQDVHIRTEYDNIYLDDIPNIRKWLLDEARAFHKRARDFLSNSDKDVYPTTSRSAAGGRIMVSIFSRASTPPQDLRKTAND